jgi:hypothetical protein
MDRKPEAAAKTNEEQDWRLRYGWNLGAGVGLGSYGILGSIEGGGTVPTFQMSIERRVGPKTWLVLNALFQNSVTDVELESNFDPTLRRTVERSSNAIGGLIGLRHAIVSGIAEVSLFGTVGATYWWIGGPRPGEDESYGSYPTLPGTKSKAFEAVGGLTVERELIEALTLRLSTGVAALRVGDESEVVAAGEGVRRRNRSFASLRLELAPVLELRFYF